MTNPPKERGSAWERRVVDYAVEHDGLPWERAPLRGSSDLLDVQGCLPDGWLIGCKALSRNSSLQDRANDAMRQAQQARATAARLFPGLGLIVPVQVMQRQGYPVGRAYAVMEYDDLLGLVVERRKWSQR